MRLPKSHHSLTIAPSRGPTGPLEWPGAPTVKTIDLDGNEHDTMLTETEHNVRPELIQHHEQGWFDTGRRYSTAILKAPSGRYIVVGSVPESLYEKAFDTEEQVMEALIERGVKRFQRADCSWYEVEA